MPEPVLPQTNIAQYKNIEINNLLNGPICDDYYEDYDSYSSESEPELCHIECPQCTFVVENVVVTRKSSYWITRQGMIKHLKQCHQWGIPAAETFVEGLNYESLFMQLSKWQSISQPPTPEFRNPSPIPAHKLQDLTASADDESDIELIVHKRKRSVTKKNKPTKTGRRSQYPISSHFRIRCPECHQLFSIITRSHLESHFNKHMKKQHPKIRLEADYFDRKVEIPTDRYKFVVQCPLEQCDYKIIRQGNLELKYTYRQSLKYHLQHTHDVAPEYLNQLVENNSYFVPIK